MCINATDSCRQLRRRTTYLLLFVDLQNLGLTDVYQRDRQLSSTS